MAMISMKREKSEMQEDSKVEYEESPYPYGLCINLDGDELDKLGMDTLPSVGKEMTITAKVFVKSTSMSEYEEGKPNKRMELQITDMEIGTAKASGEAATMLYGE